MLLRVLLTITAILLMKIYLISTIFPFKWNKNKNDVLPLAVTADVNEDDKMEILNMCGCDLLNNTKILVMRTVKKI